VDLYITVILRTIIALHRGNSKKKEYTLSMKLQHLNKTATLSSDQAFLLCDRTPQLLVLEAPGQKAHSYKPIEEVKSAPTPTVLQALPTPLQPTPKSNDTATRKNKY
jgi:hypothetical protein